MTPVFVLVIIASLQGYDAPATIHTVGDFPMPEACDIARLRLPEKVGSAYVRGTCIKVWK